MIENMPLKNPEARRAYNRQYQIKHKERLRKKRKEWEESNKERLAEYHREYHRKWYQDNKGRRKKQIAEYAKSHRGESVKRTQKYIKKHKEKVVTYRKQYELSPLGKYRRYRNQAEKRGHKFALTQEAFVRLITSPCKYCGYNTKDVGVDRTNNDGGYTPDNVVPCCKACNFMKKTMTVQQFLEHIEKIYKHNS